MKKSNTLYFISLTIFLIAYVGNIFNYLSTRNSLTLSSTANMKMKMYFCLAIIIIMLPLSILSVGKIIKSIRNNHEISTASIVLLMINLICMFGLYSFISIFDFYNYYEQYTNSINNSSALEEIVSIYKVSRTNLVYTFISGFVVHITYLVTSILALVFKLKEPKTE